MYLTEGQKADILALQEEVEEAPLDWLQTTYVSISNEIELTERKLAILKQKRNMVNNAIWSRRDAANKLEKARLIEEIEQLTAAEAGEGEIAHRGPETAP